MGTKIWYGDTYALGFDAGDTVFVEGETVHGQTSAATGIVRGWKVDSGDWATDDAAGTVWLHTVTETWADDENILDSSDTLRAVANGTTTSKLGYVSVPGNYGGGASAAIPVNSDDLYIENTSQGMTEELDALAAVALASLNIAQDFTGDIGDADNYLQVGSSAVKIGYNFGPGSQPAGSGMMKINLLTTAATIIVFNTGLSSDSTRPALRLLCNNSSTTLEVRKGEVGVAFETGETSTLSTINVGYVDNIESDAKVYIGSGVTLTTLTKKGGECLLRCAVITATNYAGELITEGNGTVGNLYSKGGEVISNSSGTITNCYSHEKGSIDFTRSAQARTVSNCYIDDEGRIKADPNVITFTNKIISQKPVILQASAA